MRTARENARRIRGGAKLILLAGVGSGLALAAQVLGYYIGMTYAQSAYLVQVIDIVLFLSFVAAGAGLYLALGGIANEVEDGAGTVTPTCEENPPSPVGVPVDEYIRVVRANQRTGRRDAFALVTFGAVWLVLSPLAPDFYRFAFYMAAIASIALGLLYLAWESIDGRRR